MNNKLVSIIIPCYNAAETIAVCLASCIQQTWSDTEIVLVDNNCTDDTITLARDLLSASHIPFQIVECETQGLTHALNRGYESISGNYVQWLDADDTLAAEKLARQVEFLQSNQAFDIAYGDWRWNMMIDTANEEQAVAGLNNGVPAIAYGPRAWRASDEHEGLAFNDYGLAQYDDYLLRLLEDKWVPPNCYLLRRELADRLKTLHSWHSTTEYANDREYFTQAALIGGRFGYARGAVAEYNTWSANQMTNRISVFDRVENLVEIFKRFRALASGPEASALSDDHRFLLEQDRELWRLPVNSINMGETDKKQYLVEKTRTGERLLVTGIEAASLMVMTTYRFAQCLEDHAKRVANRVPRLWGEHLAIMRGLRRLCDCGVLEAYERT